MKSHGKVVMFHSLNFPARNKSTGGSKHIPRNSAGQALSTYGHSRVHFLITPGVLSPVLNFGISIKFLPSKGGVGPLPALRRNWGIQKPVLIPRSSHLESRWRKFNSPSPHVCLLISWGYFEKILTSVWSHQRTSAHFKVAISRA